MQSNICVKHIKMPVVHWSYIEICTQLTWPEDRWNNSSKDYQSFWTSVFLVLYVAAKALAPPPPSTLHVCGETNYNVKIACTVHKNRQIMEISLEESFFFMPSLLFQNIKERCLETKSIPMVDLPARQKNIKNTPYVSWT